MWPCGGNDVESWNGAILVLACSSLDRVNGLYGQALNFEGTLGVRRPRLYGRSFRGKARNTAMFFLELSAIQGSINFSANIVVSANLLALRADLRA